MWEPQLAAASDAGWHVLAPHYRGFGAPEPDANSPVPAASESHSVTIDDYAGDVVDLLDACHVHEAVICGVSMGGYVALALMRLAPRYAHALVLADTKPQADTPDGIENRKRTVRLAEERGAAAVVDQLLPKLIGPTTRRERPEVADRVRAIAMSNSVHSLVAATTAMMTRPDSTDLLPAIHVPTLILVGDEDEITPAAVAEEMKAAVAGSELCVIGGAGHLSNLEKPEVFNDALTRFLTYRV